MFSKVCADCGQSFQAERKAQRYCSLKCRDHAANARRINRPGHWLTVELECPNCKKKFFRSPDSSPSRRYCSDECSIEGTRKALGIFKKLNPEAMKRYNANRRAKHGSDTLANRLRRKYPDLPTICEASENSRRCTESRVLDIAHKPAFKRNGAWRTMNHYERHMFWMLCPTHHKLLDQGICTPKELGLEPE